MKSAYWCVSLSLLLLLIREDEAFIVAAALVGAAGVFGSGIYSYMYHERCISKWIDFNPRGLKTDLDNRLFGQHIALPIIFKAVSGFMSSHSPQKPLVLSLHGITGTGKNYVSKMIAKNIYKKGMHSDFVHFFIATKDFPHSIEVPAYKVWLRNYIETNVAKCERSLFIFDEMDKMHPGLTDVIKPYLDHHDQVGHISYQKSIFIFLSNAGGDQIGEIALSFVNMGQQRESIRLRDLEETVSLSVFNNKNGGFFRSSLIDRSLVDFFVPFLPLEHRHVIQCVLAEMKIRNLPLSWHVANKFASDLVYFPKHERVFSSSGCKTIEKRLPFYL